MSDERIPEKSKETKKALLVIELLLLSLIIFLFVLTHWGKNHFGHIHFEEVLFTLSSSLSGSDPDFIKSFILTVFLPITIPTILLIIDIFRKNKKEHRLNFKIRGKEHSLCIYPIKNNFLIFVLIFIVGCFGLCFSFEKYFGVLSYVDSYLSRSTVIEEEYVDPKDVAITFPEKKKNLIYILLESGESSLQDKENGGLFEENYIPQMTKIARENVSFSQTESFVGAEPAPSTGWTMAGMVSQFSGIPLKFNLKRNILDKQEAFLPGVTNLGDILKKEGYKNYFMIGSDARFAGRDRFMSQHGGYEILDYYYAQENGKIPEDYYVWWGYEDLKLYEFAKEQLTKISNKKTPFNFTMLTVDTHHIGGYVCPNCRNDFSEQYGNVWNCASRQLEDFINWIKEQPFYEDTVIVISGDHCSMDPNFYSNIPGKRNVYNAIVHPFAEPINQKNRKFTTLDMFPTTLAAMGANIEGNRLGLGTNLFAQTQTLSEEMGYDKYFNLLSKQSDFYNKKFLLLD